LTGETLTTAGEKEPELRVADIFATFPVAMLWRM
jgi:hypothetical protein